MYTDINRDIDILTDIGIDQIHIKIDVHVSSNT